MDTERFLATPVGLARDVDDGNQCAFFGAVAILLDDLVHRLGQAPAFQQADFALTRPGKAVVGIGNHGNETHRLLAEKTVGDLE
ncbi:lipoprotein [Pseudomonas syringae pv. coryli]|uniref:Lipoprotein n=1 Tax=Pseudomonas syringae pv. coryli TaxID=317659 RepID=A0A0P9S173_9PSED|nr:lipoprotein [Pseudomonas syringae pv. coryli]